MQVQNFSFTLANTQVTLMLTTNRGGNEDDKEKCSDT